MNFLTLASILVSTAFGHTPEDYRGVQTSREQKIESIRNEEIHAVKTVLALRAPENRKAELFLRLAELYLEAYRADFLLEGKIHEKALAERPNARLSRERSIDDLKYGIAAAEEILKLKVDSAKLDKVYYFLGYNYGELGQTDKSLQYYKKLTQLYPDSVYAAEGRKAAGDEAFRHGKFADAQILYEQSLQKTGDPSQRARLYHKLAWCYYRQKSTRNAIESMKKAIAISESDEEKFLNIREEGLRDIAIFYAESGQVDEAIVYFREHASEDRLAESLEKLGKEYERSGQTDKAQQVYDVLLKLGRKEESSFRVAVKLIDMDIVKQKYPSAYQRLVALQIPSSVDADSNIALINLKKQVRQTGVNNHDRYRRAEEKKEALPYLKAADQFYTVYLAKFLPQDQASKAERNEIRMYLAEVKRDLGDSATAASLYKTIIQDQDPKYAKEAAQLWVGSLAQEIKKKSVEKNKTHEAPSQLELDFVSASDLLEESIPNSTESREARLRSAQILAAYPSEKKNAIQRASKLATEAPNTPQGVLAARLWLQLEPNQETLTAIQANPALFEADKKGKGELAQAKASVSKKLKVDEISELEKNKDYGKAAQGYEAFAKESKTEKEAENAYLGALNAYAQSGDSEQVARIMREWKTKYPKSKTVEASVKNQATLFFIRGLFNDSAELFLGIGRQFKDLSSYLTSAALFDGGLQRRKAREVYKMALALAPKEEEKAKIYKYSAQTAESIKDDLAALNEWKTCYSLNSSLKAECGSQIGNYYLRLNDFASGKAVFEKIVAITKGPSSQSPYIAYAQFRIAQALEKEMQNIPLEFPEEQLLKAFNQRIEELKPVSNAYQKAISMGGPWGIAATERLGDVAIALSSEVEKVLQSAKAKDNLKQALQPVADSLRKKAIENSKDAYRLALKNQILSPALPVIQDRLVEAKVLKMNYAQGARLGVKLIGMSPDGGTAGQESAFKQTRDLLLKSQSNALAWIDYGNLLWGIGKPGLSKVAYQRALDFKTRTADALNNLAVVLVSDQGFENWFAANEALALWKRAVAIENANSAALYNLGHYFNYFRLFEPALAYFQKVLRKVSIGEVHDGLGTAHFGLAQNTEGELELNKAEELGQKKNRFVKKYIEAGRAKSFSDCLSSLDDIAQGELRGFEKISYERMKMRCEL